jgi:uncharacterized protein
MILMDMKRHVIKRHIKEIEKMYGIEVLFAAERGSRMYGSHTEHSDYDIGFIYRFPLHLYLHINRPKEVIALKKDNLFEFHGWDIYKTLSLYRESNPSLYEWIHSPIVYNDHSFLVELRKNIVTDFSLFKLAKHYENVCIKNVNVYVKNNNVKTLFQAVRAYLSLHWIGTYQKHPPINYVNLCNQQFESFDQKDFLEILHLKKQGHESKIDQYATMTNKILTEIKKLTPTINELPNDKISVEKLNRLILREWKMGDQFEE